MNNIESLFFDFLKLRREVRRQAFFESDSNYSEPGKLHVDIS